jgi:hypothetical protein
MSGVFPCESNLSSSWDLRQPGAPEGIAFVGELISGGVSKAHRPVEGDDSQLGA